MVSDGTVIQLVTSDDPWGSFQLSTFCDCSVVIVFLDCFSQWWCYHRGHVWERDVIQHNLLVGSTQWQTMHPDFYCAYFSLNKNIMILKMRMQIWRAISNVSNFIADTSSCVKMKDTRWYRKSVRKITWCLFFISICKFFWCISNAEKLFIYFTRFLHVSLETVRGKSSAAVAWKFVDFMSVWVISSGLIVSVGSNFNSGFEGWNSSQISTLWEQLLNDRENKISIRLKLLNYDITVINWCLIDC